MALSCLQSAWTRARRSLIGARRSASSRSARASRSSSISPLNSLARRFGGGVHRRGGADAHRL